jgi:hypothetical protein
MSALDVVGGLSKPSKMPGLAFGFSADKCLTGSKLRTVAGSVCADCYACKGMYRFPGVKAAHDRRWTRLQAALNSSSQREDYVTAFITLLAKQSWFRWHDSGDLQSVAHLELIADIARATPHVRHWLPTREYRMVKAFLKTATCPENLNIRLSAHMVDQTTPGLAGCTTSAVYAQDPPGYACPARSQGNQCGSCRACWDPHVPLVTYSKH